MYPVQSTITHCIAKKSKANKASYYDVTFAHGAKRKEANIRGKPLNPSLCKYTAIFEGRKKINAGECKRRKERFAKKKRLYGRRFAEKRLKPLRRFSRQSLFFLTPDLPFRRCVSRVATLYKAKQVKGEKRNLCKYTAIFERRINYEQNINML